MHNFDYLDGQSLERLKEHQRWAEYLGHLPESQALIVECQRRIDLIVYGH